MLAFLSTVIVLGALIFVGYCLNMYLYSQGAVGVSSRQMEYAVVESAPIGPMRDVATEERDYGLRYARVGLLIVACFAVLLVFSLVAVILSVV